jgi:glutathione S-transferase
VVQCTDDLFLVLKDGPQIPFFVKPITRIIAGRVDAMLITPNLQTQFGFLESQLASSPGGGKYICGTELTAADLLLTFPLIAALSREKIDRKKYPKLAAYGDMLKEHEGYNASVKKVEEVTGEKFSSNF